MKKGLLFLVVSLSSLGLTLSLEADNLHLELASVLFRHGDRSPVNTFPSDSYTEWDWPQGYGQLSIVGMQQQHQLGTLLRQRYIVNETCCGLVCTNYTRVQMRVRSTDVDRCLMSVESQLSAFFPPGDNQTFQEDLPWQPIPVHTVPTEDDALLRSWDSCPAFQQLQLQDQESTAYKAMEAKYKDFLADLTHYTGITVNLGDVWSIEDTVYIENVSPGYEAPSWATAEVVQNLSTVSEWSLTLMFNSTQKHRLTAGTWLNKILTDMKNKTKAAGNKTLEDMKLFLYSAHDTTVAAMTSALGVFNERQPGYATAFAVELYSSSHGKYYVKMFRRNGPDSDTFELLNATFCSSDGLCTLEEFEIYVKPLIPDDLKKECNTVPTTQPTTPDPQKLEQQNNKLKIAVISLGSTLGVVLITVIILTVLLISACRKKNASSQRLYSALHADS